jgi:hypothetical protein
MSDWMYRLYREAEERGELVPEVLTPMWAGLGIRGCVETSYLGTGGR